MKTPTHTLIECFLDLAQVEDMLYDKYKSRLDMANSDEFLEKLSSLSGTKFESISSSERASMWADVAIKELSIPWKIRLINAIETHLEDEYDNPYDAEGLWDTNPILSRMLYHATQENWDMVVSEAVKGYTQMGAAFPINLTEDKWLDIRIIPLQTEIEH